MDFNPLSIQPASAIRALAVATLAALGGACDGNGSLSTVTDYTSAKRDMRQFIDERLGDEGVPGLSVALVDAQETVWAEGFGYADVERAVPATANTVYEMGSISKVLTATAVMQLVEREKLQLDQPMRAVTPAVLPKTRFPDANPVTLRNLLTHHGGIPRLLTHGYTDEPLPLREHLEGLSEEYTAFPPGFVRAYSNTGFVVIGRAVEVGSGLSFTRYMDVRVLDRLAMNNSSFRLEPHLASRLAKGYDREIGMEPPPALLDNEAPAASLRSSVGDMTRYIKMLLNDGKSGGRRVLRAESIDAMWRPQNADNALDLGNRIGLAWELGELATRGGASVKRVGHEGTTARFRAALALIPEHDLGVVVAANADNAGGLVSEVVHRTLRLALRAKTGMRIRPVEASPHVKPVKRSGDSLQAVSGTYESPFGPLLITPRDGELVAENPLVSLTLEPYERGFFRMLTPGGPVWLTFETVDGHELLILHPQIGVREIFGTRIERRPLPDVWLRRKGEYRVPDEQAPAAVEAVTLTEVLGHLVLTRGNAQILTLRPESDRLAVVPGLGRGKGQVVRFGSHDDGDRLFLYGIELRRLDPAIDNQ